MTSDEVRALLAIRCQEAGGQAKWGRQHGFGRRYVNDILLGRREPGPEILRTLGLRKSVHYEPTVSEIAQN